MPHLHVIAFATAGDLLRGSPADIELPPGSRLCDLRRHLEERHPALVALWPRLAIAIDGTLVSDPEAPLPEGAEVALLPPVSGGSGA